MDIIIKGRGHGKTTDLIRMSAESKSPIVTGNLPHAKAIEDKAKHMGLDIPKPIYVSDRDALDAQICGVREVLVDDVDWVLTLLLGCVEVKCCTVTPTRND